MNTLHLIHSTNIPSSSQPALKEVVGKVVRRYLLDMGHSVTKRTWRGTLKLEISLRQKSISSFSPALLPGCAEIGVSRNLACCFNNQQMRFCPDGFCPVGFSAPLDEAL